MTDRDRERQTERNREKIRDTKREIHTHTHTETHRTETHLITFLTIALMNACMTGKKEIYMSFKLYNAIFFVCKIRFN